MRIRLGARYTKFTVNMRLSKLFYDRIKLYVFRTGNL